MTSAEIDEEDIQYRTIYVVQPVHDFSPLTISTKNIKFITNGKELVEDMPEVIAEALQGFDPFLDAVIPVGRSIICMLVGAELAKRFKGQYITFGLFRTVNEQKNYAFMEVLIG